MYVVQYELQPGSQGLRPPPAECVASLNTHDMPTFQGFLQSKDVDDLQSLGFFTPEQARQEKERRGAIRHGMEETLPPEERGKGAATDAALLRLRLDHLAASPARMVLVNLEDLWQETEPQNVPGTHDRAAQLAAEGKVFVRGILDPRGRGRAVEAGGRIEEAEGLMSSPEGATFE